MYEKINLAAIAAVASYGVYTNQAKETMSDVMLANVEALARGEGTHGDYQTMGYCTPFRMDLKCQYTPTSTLCYDDCE